MFVVLLEPVNSTPNIEDRLMTVTVSQGDWAELPCVASGHPLPTYHWTKDGQPVVLGHGRVHQTEGTLSIKDSGVRDSGLYLCTTTNSLGDATSTVNLIVTGQSHFSVCITSNSLGLGTNSHVVSTSTPR